VATYPISAGRDQYPTMDGTHIVLDRESQVQMISSSVGIPVNSPNGYDETVYSDVHISDSGEYVHAAPWSVAAQGNTNVSHGCININPANAAQFFNFSRVGDIVNVVGGPRPPVPGDHGVMDWSTPWTSFTPVAVSPLTPPPATPASS
jgi:lipoprotein-anchoring transpeptidase ErfK/SrfK